MTTYREARLSLGPASYWRLGEPLGSVAVDELFGRHGRYNTGVALGVPGLIGDDADTAMTATPNAGMIIPAGSAMPVWSLDFWTRSNGANPDFSAYFSQASDTFDIATFAPGDLRFYDGAGFTSIGVGSDPTRTFWVWEFSAATGLQVWKNAALVFSDIARGRALPGGEDYGLGVFGPGAPHDGTIDTFDEVALTAGLLTQAQITYLWNVAQPSAARAPVIDGFDPVGALVSELRAADVASRRVRGYEPAPGDAKPAGSFQRFIVIVDLSGPPERAVVQRKRILFRCYGATPQDAGALWIEVQQALHLAGPRLASSGFAIYNTRDDTGGSPHTDPDTHQPYYDGVYVVTTGLSAVT